MKLRPYQVEFLHEILSLYSQGVQGVIGDMPTGSGKTVCMARLSQIFVKKTVSVLILVHRDELVRQTSHKLAAMGVSHGIVASKMHNENPRALVQVAMVQTIVRRLSRIKREFGLIIVDEAHLGAAKSYVSIIERWSEALRLGMSATPYRMERKGLSVIGTHVVKGRRIKNLIEDGSLVKFRTFGVNVADLDNLKIVNGDYDRESQSKILNRPHVVGEIVSHYERLASGRSALFFGASREHSKSACAEFLKKGIKAYHIDGETPYEIRIKAVKMLEAGRIKVLCNYGCLTEGFDSTIISAIIVARKTASIALWKQMIGRGLRLHEGKEDCVIIDHGGNALEHGNVTWEHPYDIFGSKKKRERTIICKVCKNCATVVEANAIKCPACDFSFEVDGSGERKIRQVDGDLVEITSDEPVVKFSKTQLMAQKIASRSAILERIDGFLGEMGL